MVNASLFTVLPDNIRIDRDTETDIMSTMHCFLRAKHDDLEDTTETILYGPLTQSKIERWWRELLDRMERFFKSSCPRWLKMVTMTLLTNKTGENYCLK